MFKLLSIRCQSLPPLLNVRHKGSGALSGKMFLVRIVEINKIYA